MWSNNNNCSICRLFDWFPCMYHCTKQGSRRQQTLLGRGVESHTELYASLTWRHRLTLWCSNVVKFVRREIGEIVRYLPHKNFGCLSNVATMRIAPKIYQSQPPTFGSHCSRFHPSRFIFGRVIAERVNTVFLPRTVFIKIELCFKCSSECGMNNCRWVLGL